MKVIPDTSCLVAAICTWHEHHKETLDELSTRAKAGDKIVIAAPVLVETYAVLTRLPPPHRLSLDNAHRLLEVNWGKAATVALEAHEYWDLPSRCRDAGIGGGQT